MGFIETVESTWNAGRPGSYHSLMRLVLASASPRRADLLRAAGFEFDIRAVDVDERARDGESAADYVCRLASEKAARVFEGLALPAQGWIEAGHHKDSPIVVGADTAVVVDGDVLGKPGGDGEARGMLRRLSGRSHQVMTGVSLRSASREVGGLETTTVWFADLTADEIEWYVGTGEGRDKAGAYAIQGRAARFIPRIDGSYSNVVGLPIALVHALMTRLSSG
jgi:septum formation protein